MIEHLQNVYIGNHGIIYDEFGTRLGMDYNAHMYSFMKMPDLNLEQDEKNVKDAIKNKAYIEVNDHQYIHAFHYFNIYVWGHLHDTINNLEDFEHIGKYKLAAPLISSHVKELFLHFELVGYKIEDIHSFDTRSQVYKFKNIYVNTRPTKAVLIYNKDWIEKKYIYENPYLKESPEELKNKKYKLYLSRNNINGQGPKGGRKTVNEDAVWNILKNKGYIKLDGSEGLMSHIKYFAGAEKIILSHGSLIKNIMYSLNRDIEVWEFYPLGRMTTSPKYTNDNIFQVMAKTMNIQKYFFLPIESDKEQNITLDLELIDRIS